MFDLDHAAESLDELTNGIALAHILHELDSEFDPSHLESIHGTSKYLTNKRNIQAVYKGLFRFIRRQVPELSCQAKKFDYHAVAENPDSQGISQVCAVKRRKMPSTILLADSPNPVVTCGHGLCCCLGPRQRQVCPENTTRPRP